MAGTARFWLSATTAVVAGVLLGGCAEPTVDRVVVWVDSVDDGAVRKVQVYDRGQRYAIELEPDVPGSDTESLGLAVDPRGRGVALSGQRTTRYVGFDDTRQPVLSAAPLFGAELTAAFSFTRNADALLRAPAGSGGDRFSFVPIASPVPAVAEAITAPEGTATGEFSMVSAADAPVFVWVEHGQSPSRATGRVQAVAYPSDVHPDGLQVEALTVLGQGELFGTPPGLVGDRQIRDQWCPHRTCISPDGRSVVTPAPGRCAFWSWRWDGAEDETSPTLIEIEDGCPAQPRPLPSLFAQIDVDLLVLDDDDRVYLADLSARTMRSAPKLWTNAGQLRLGEGGRSVVLVSDDSRVVRVDAQGPRIIAADAIPCAGPPSVAHVSANGLWMVRVCLPSEGEFAGPQQGVIIRASPLGTETFASVPMEALGIDDRGNALLFSRSDSGEPRGLFVLDAGGTVTRVDPLEPEPTLVRSTIVDDIYFSTQQVLR
ncbi:MAG: hypothetical protein AAGA54_03480 [Myxococcota bacterium]